MTHAAAGLTLVLAVPAAAQPVDNLQRGDALVQAIGWRLSHANSRFCPRAAAGIGLLLGDGQTYQDPAAARVASSLSGDIAVAGMGRQGTSARAGLDAKMVVMAVAGKPIGPPPRQGNWDRS